MLISTLFLSAMQALVRYLGQAIPAIEIVFFRGLLGLVLMLPLFIKGGVKTLFTLHPKLHLLRGLLGVASIVTWYYGLTRVPIAEATVLSFVGIVFGMLGTVLFLDEKMNLRRMMAMLLCFVGVTIVLRPGFNSIDIGVWAIIFSATLWGMGLVVVKVLSRTDSSFAIVAWAAILITLLSLFPALAVWVWPTLEQYGWLLLIAIFGTLGHLAVTRALSLADASLVLPLDCTRLVWAVLIGIFFFAEHPDVLTLIGSALIVTGVTYIVRQSRATATVF